MTTIVVNNQRLGFGGLSRSYPFLDLARILQRPYASVLGAAEDYDNGRCDNPDEVDRYRKLTPDEVAVVHRVCAAPWRWQFPPEGRGL